MVSVPDDLRQRLRQYGQEHVLAFWDRLDDEMRRGLLSQLQALDLDLLRRLYARRDEEEAVPPAERIEPVPVIGRHTPQDAERRRLGEEALRQGEVAALVVAGGQGSRLGFEHPKGMYPVGPVSHKPLFQVHAEKALARGRRHGKPIPLLVMTSPATHDETVAFFKEHRNFGLPAEEVFFFQQGTMPALDLQTGRLLLEAPDRLFLSPDGHGGTLTALASSGLLERLRRRGIRHISYFQVDNPLAPVADPLFLGHHIHARAEVSSRVLAKSGPEEKVGVFALVDGRCVIIEYIHLPKELKYRTDATGKLVMWAGSPAIHIFDVDFLGRVTAAGERMPFHVARKKVPHIDAEGRPVEPAKENALKFERFIFDVLPLAERWTVIEGVREEEFAPLKNATGPDSPATVEQALCTQSADWLERAGVKVPRQPDGSVAVKLEVSPLLALDAEELARRLPPGTTVSGPRYFGEQP
jgi:UDP-N-acetylglucosamine/UDP-N-acetylgalactosamine diphosphorylase